MFILGIGFGLDQRCSLAQTTSSKDISPNRNHVLVATPAYPQSASREQLSLLRLPLRSFWPTLLKMPQRKKQKGLKVLRSLTSMEDEMGRQSVYAQMVSVTDNAYRIWTVLGRGTLLGRNRDSHPM